jgi:hypothetical protein
MVRGLRDDEKGFDKYFSRVVFSTHCGGARKSEAILDALAAEVNGKSSKILAAGKLLQLLQRSVRIFGRFRDMRTKKARSGERAER